MMKKNDIGMVQTRSNILWHTFLVPRKYYLHLVMMDIFGSFCYGGLSLLLSKIILGWLGRAIISVISMKLNWNQRDTTIVFVFVIQLGHKFRKVNYVKRKMFWLIPSCIFLVILTFQPWTYMNLLVNYEYSCCENNFSDQTYIFFSDWLRHRRNLMSTSVPIR
jgi:hypothetical protein